MNALERTVHVRPPSITGLHHVRLPVTDVLVSRDWYVDVLGFESVLDHEEEDRVVGTVLQHPSGVVLGLHVDPRRAAALSGFVVVSLCAGPKSNLEHFSRCLDAAEVDHSAIQIGNLGWYLELADPDGILVEIHTSEQPAADEA
jgi:catechol 2,3-dioxygenase-like lactoylglutathione lyase family enzyme